MSSSLSYVFLENKRYFNNSIGTNVVSSSPKKDRAIEIVESSKNSSTRLEKVEKEEEIVDRNNIMNNINLLTIISTYAYLSMQIE